MLPDMILLTRNTALILRDRINELERQFNDRSINLESSYSMLLRTILDTIELCRPQLEFLIQQVQDANSCSRAKITFPSKDSGQTDSPSAPSVPQVEPVPPVETTTKG